MNNRIFSDKNIYDVACTTHSLLKRYKKLLISFFITFSVIILFFLSLDIKYYFISNEISSLNPIYKYELFYYNLLTVKEQLLYDGLKEAVTNYSDRTETLPAKYSDDEFSRVTEYFIADNPQCFYVDFENISLQNSIYKTSLKIEYLFAPETIGQVKEELNAAINEAVAGAALFAADEEKEIYLHDYLLDKCSHAEPLTDAGKYVYNTAYGALVLGRAYSGGYALAFKMLLEKCGIYNNIVFGETESGRHIWNTVYIDDKFYHTDSAWNDAELEFAPDIRFHGYFNLSDRVMFKDHTPGNVYILPSAVDLYTYYDIKKISAVDEPELVEICDREVLAAGREGRNYFEVHMAFKNFPDDLLYTTVINSIKKANEGQQEYKFMEVCRIFNASEHENSFSVQLFR